ncbi:hypothetical protein E2562_001480 [Oryza meyeriana var. granulata]|uniref:Uncharacterized protein n=1 Tax=Oryza meyeriana var. granulata TaxID=110450 RepID=A0A6G1DCZ3_9ORYZ|nr:hypothetical protein E2562_001480 [Oryza meyeriana var. granulata]
MSTRGERRGKGGGRSGRVARCAGLAGAGHFVDEPDWPARYSRAVCAGARKSSPWARMAAGFAAGAAARLDAVQEFGVDDAAHGRRTARHSAG